MITVRKSSERGKTVTDWLTSYHSFSFNQYYDPAHTNFGPLVVLNDDIIKAGTGFGAHPHRNMEIVTYVLKGTLEHKDSTGKIRALQAGEVGRMSAGTGIVHSEYNRSKTEPVHLLQTWFHPKSDGMAPSHEEKSFTVDQRRNLLLPVASDNVNLGGAVINSPATMYVSRLEIKHLLTYKFSAEQAGYVFVADGDILINCTQLRTGDSALCIKESDIQVEANQDSEIVVFDVAHSN